MNNRKLAKLLKLGGILLELHNENSFKVRSYENAADGLKRLGRPALSMKEDELEIIQGIGKSMAKKILQVRDTGTIQDIAKLLSDTPEGVVKMAQIKGIGPKKVRSLWLDMGILSPEELMEACIDGEVEKLKGFGKKTQQNIVEVLEYYFESKGKFMYSEAEEDGELLLKELRKNPKILKAEFTADMRRKSIVIKQIDILLTTKDDYSESDIIDDLASAIIKEGKFITKDYSIPVVLHYAKEGNWTEQLFITTGNDAHLSKLKADTFTGIKEEEEVYLRNELPYIIPEMREGVNEFEIGKEIKPHNIITLSDLKGCLHNHSTYSDGANTVEEMANYCREQGLEYFGISDHSQTAVYANGLKLYAVLNQFKEIDLLNEKMAPFKIFKGIESDILSNGNLDYESDVLSQFDYIVASIHSNLKMPEDEATQRLIKAIENPYTTILGHPTGRLLLVREGYPINHQKVIDACAANNVIIEINANPRRLDLDWKWLNYAVNKGVMLSINPDAHELAGIHDMYFGVCAARKAGITKEQVLNTKSVSEVEAIFKNKRQ